MQIKVTLLELLQLILGYLKVALILHKSLCVCVFSGSSKRQKRMQIPENVPST